MNDARPGDHRVINGARLRAPAKGPTSYPTEFTSRKSKRIGCAYAGRLSGACRL